MKTEVIEQRYIVEFLADNEEKNKVHFSFYQTAINFLNEKLQENCKECSMYLEQTVKLVSNIYVST